jgi:hypothetical protein
MPSKSTPSLSSDAQVAIELIERRIYLIRGHKVMIDRDLAALYQVKPIALRQQVKRNRERFSPDFMFQLNREEGEFLVSQNVIPSLRGLGESLPYAFTQEGVAMLFTVLRTARAVQANIGIMGAFVRLREILTRHRDLAQTLEQLEKKYDSQFKVVFDPIRKLMEPEPVPSRRRIGFIDFRLRGGKPHDGTYRAPKPLLRAFQDRLSLPIAPTLPSF